ncbi:hypothetical protein UPYG_G00344940 [Umbra pygmaea]|uniref:Uncharacterized protein n=1 Tax=Umbra pygmaea TaxID=75934 RepID=A0ABD0WBR7_UMBPY
MILRSREPSRRRSGQISPNATHMKEITNFNGSLRRLQPLILDSKPRFRMRLFGPAWRTKLSHWQQAESMEVLPLKKEETSCSSIGGGGWRRIGSQKTWPHQQHHHPHHHHISRGTLQG